MEKKLLFFIPTYNESENVRIIYKLLKGVPLAYSFDVLFVDDNSPDGTGKILEEMKLSDPSLYVLHRQGKSGIGSAHKAGIKWAYDNQYDTLITLDCDLTHTPDDSLKFLNNNKNANIVVGSRYLEEGSLNTWSFSRKLLTRFGHFLTVNLLQMPYDASGAFRLYQLNKIPSAIFDKIESNSYSFFFESLLIMHINNVSIHEVPIHLPKRTYGNSKMQLSDLVTSIRFLLTMFYKKTFKKKNLKANI
jgi:dolichol-phosphate mannosyltransferase